MENGLSRDVGDLTTFQVDRKRETTSKVRGCRLVIMQGGGDNAAGRSLIHKMGQRKIDV